MVSMFYIFMEWGYEFDAVHNGLLIERGGVVVAVLIS